MPGHDDRRLGVFVFTLDLLRRVVKRERAFHCEEHLHHFVLRAHQALTTQSWLLVVARVEPNDHLIDEAAIARVEEVPEILSELPKDQLNELGLNIWGEPLIEIELFNDKVMVAFESFLDSLSYVQVEICWDVSLTDR